MNFGTCINEIGVLLSRLGELQIPYPLGTNWVASPKADVKEVRAFCANYGLAEDFVDFYCGCDGISMNDVWNRYWVFGFEEVVHRGKSGDIKYVHEIGGGT